jgi:hypothetical protein
MPPVAPRTLVRHLHAEAAAKPPNAGHPAARTELRPNGHGSVRSSGPSWSCFRCRRVYKASPSSLYLVVTAPSSILATTSCSEPSRWRVQWWFAACRASLPVAAIVGRARFESAPEHSAVGCVVLRVCRSRRSRVCWGLEEERRLPSMMAPDIERRQHTVMPRRPCRRVGGMGAVGHAAAGIWGY